jgi:hypothetical protein
LALVVLNKQEIQLRVAIALYQGYSLVLEAAPVEMLAVMAVLVEQVEVVLCTQLFRPLVVLAQEDRDIMAEITYQSV